VARGTERRATNEEGKVGFVITKTKCIVAGAAVLILVGGLLMLLPKIQDGMPRSIFSVQTTMAQLKAGLAGFCADFGDYPPSDKEHMAARPYGYQNLAYYLCGPNGQGWGEPAGGLMPFGGSSQKIFGPYFGGAAMGPSTNLAPSVTDAFRPPMPILYFRAEPDEARMFDAADNPIDPTGAEGFASQEHFEMLAKRPSGEWVRADYLLISAGSDRLFGYMVEDEVSGELRPAPPGQKANTYCDDITNFQY